MSEARIKALMVDVDGVLITGRPADGRHWAADLEADLGLSFEKIHTEFFGINACHAHLAPHVDEPPEVQVRIGARDRDRGKLERFSRELIPLVLNGPPTATGYGEGRPAVREVVAYWPTLVPRSAVDVSIEVIG